MSLVVYSVFMVEFFFCYLKWTWIKNPHYFISYFFPLERRICQRLFSCWHHMPWCQLKEAAWNIKRVCKFHYYPSLLLLQSRLSCCKFCEKNGQGLRAPAYDSQIMNSGTTEMHIGNVLLILFLDEYLSQQFFLKEWQSHLITL